jgi:hypothetical protein
MSPKSTGHANEVFSGVQLLSGETITVRVEKDESVVFCNQNWRDYSGIFFPPTSRIQPAESRWMNGAQEDLTDLYGWTALVALVGFILVSHRRLSLYAQPYTNRLKHTNAMPGFNSSFLVAL